jgi:ATP-dependent protease ClpP protease subunit
MEEKTMEQDGSKFAKISESQHSQPTASVAASPAAAHQDQQQAQEIPETVYISFSAEISGNTTETLIATISNCANKGVKTVYLMMSTPGGSVMLGMNLYNVLRALPIHLITHNVGNVDSIGNAVFLAGAERFACAHSTFMFHGVGFDINGQYRLEEKFLKEKLDSIHVEHNRIGSVIEERTNLERQAIAKLFLEAQTKDATFALGCGIVKEIKDVNVPSGATVIPLVFQR